MNSFFFNCPEVSPDVPVSWRHRLLARLPVPSYVPHYREFSSNAHGRLMRHGASHERLVSRERLMGA